MRDALHRRGAGSNNRHALISELLKISGRITAGVLVIPATGMKGVSPVAINAGDRG